jgi:hypothetical protein
MLRFAPFFNSAHPYAYTLDRNEPKLEEPLEQVQAEDTNTVPEQDKPQCI